MGVISPLIWVITIGTLIKGPLLPTLEPPSRGLEWCQSEVHPDCIFGAPDSDFLRSLYFKVGFVWLRQVLRLHAVDGQNPA